MSNQSKYLNRSNIFIESSYNNNSLTKFYFQAVIFVIDSSNKERLSEAQGELVKLISEEILKDACLLILANKQVKLLVEVIRSRYILCSTSNT